MTDGPRSLLISPQVDVVDLGRIDHAAGREQMRHRTAAARAGRGTLLFCEHDPVITVTRTTAANSLLTDEQSRAADGIDLVHTDRGGDATFHGPGQLVGYPVLALRRSQGHLPLGDYLRSLELGLLAGCRALGVQTAHTKDGLTGIWVDHAEAHTAHDAKVCAIGVGLSPHAVTRHGFALNLHIDLELYARHLVPCGLDGLDVTSLSRLGLTPSRSEVMSVLAQALCEAWGAASPDVTPIVSPSSIAGTLHPDGAVHG